MALENVKCNVSNCSYWKNQYCSATAIEVSVDGGGNNANDKEMTNCHTFEAKS